MTCVRYVIIYNDNIMGTLILTRSRELCSYTQVLRAGLQALPEGYSGKRTHFSFTLFFIASELSPSR